jgi:hypothetical protein
MHGQYIRSMDRQLISEKDSYYGCWDEISKERMKVK